ncbi:Caltractin [Folsomia candida]|uniref:Caltractin n=1 Tax=Folsomia candida TaxID=158441 RepID=A0A226DX05_FOLCA|nr:Caltractin [Folsomia candida]
MSSTDQSFSRDEVERAFQNMRSYSETSKTIEVSDLGPLFKCLGYRCTPEQFSEYEIMWIGAFEGKIPLDVFAALMVALDDNGQLMKILVTALDRDKDGVVSEGEFQAIADTDKDGKVSIDEAVEWFTKQGKTH